MSVGNSTRFEVIELSENDAEDIVSILSMEDPTYISHFTPFDLDPVSVRNVLSNARKDKYWGYKIKGMLTGIFMLRGLDQGYQKPSFGVYINSANSGKGLAKLALEYATCWCSVNNIELIMLKTYEENKRALNIYLRAGFNKTGICPDTGQFILEKKIK